MQIIRIFGPADSPEAGLWSLIEEGNEKSELEKTFETWRDPERMYGCCKYHHDDLKTAFGFEISIKDAADELMEEAEDLEDELLELASREKPDASLQQLFRPLDNRENAFTELQLSKGSAKRNYRRNSKLRLYAVRFGEHTYLITGGAVKLTALMKDRPHTELQLKKLIRVRDWLKDMGLLFPEDLIQAS